MKLKDIMTIIFIVTSIKQGILFLGDKKNVNSLKRG